MGLAGPRVKQRISVDPRNLAWSNDQNKFGFKMLSKMGWSPGKGLGINEDGEKEHIKLSIKQDNLGIGATRKTTDNWLDNSNAFSELLKGLNDKFQNEDKEDDGNEKSEQDSSGDKLESKKKKKSKKGSKNNKNKKSISTSNNNDTSDSGSLSSIRLAHRAKFLKSKKAVIQDSDRLNEIFGIKSNINNIESVNMMTNTTIASSASSDNDESDMKDGIVTKINEMSAHEYFSRKMKELKTSEIASSSLVSHNNRINDDIDEQPNFSMGLGFVNNDYNSKLTSTSKKRKIDDDIDNDNSSDDKLIKSKKKEKESKKYKKKIKEKKT